MSARLHYPEAAAELRVPEGWLRKNIKRLPHKKLGRCVYFTPADIERIDAMAHNEPQGVRPALTAATSAPQTEAHPLAGLKPLPGRRRRAG